jgi:hypothetical protein
MVYSFASLKVGLYTRTIFCQFEIDSVGPKFLPGCRNNFRSEHNVSIADETAVDRCIVEARCAIVSFD